MTIKHLLVLLHQNIAKSVLKTYPLREMLKNIFKKLHDNQFGTLQYLLYQVAYDIK